MVKKQINLADGKYTIVYDESNQYPEECLRHGEPWQKLVGDNLILALCQKIETQQEEAELSLKLTRAIAAIAQCSLMSNICLILNGHITQWYYNGLGADEAGRAKVCVLNSYGTEEQQAYLDEYRTSWFLDFNDAEAAGYCW